MSKEQIPRPPDSSRTAPVQRSSSLYKQPATEERTGADRILELAQRGTSGPGGPLPHQPALQQSFGRYDVSGIQAHVGEGPTDAARSMFAKAFTRGNHVAFADTPSLHTTAHEAAHVMQQRAGVQFSRGIGARGDAYERHAEAVADRVVRGESVESLLAQMAPPPTSPQSSAAPSDAVQLALDEQQKKRLEKLLNEWQDYHPTKWPAIIEQLQKFRELLKEPDDNQLIQNIDVCLRTIGEGLEPAYQESELEQPLRSTGKAAKDMVVELEDGVAIDLPDNMPTTAVGLLGDKLLVSIPNDVLNSEANQARIPDYVQIPEDGVYAVITRSYLGYLSMDKLPEFPFEKTMPKGLKNVEIRRRDGSNFPKRAQVKKGDKLNIVDKQNDQYRAKFTTKWQLSKDDQSEVEFETATGRFAIADVENVLEKQEPISKLNAKFSRRGGKILPASALDPAISHEDVFQSAISDCYLQAALMALADTQPQAIKRMFEFPDDEHVIVTLLNKRKPPIRVELDKKLILNEAMDPALGGKKDRYLWPAFIQKAIAVTKGSYTAVAMGHSREVYEKVLGDSDSFSIEDHRNKKGAWELLNRIVQARADGMPITLHTGSFAKKTTRADKFKHPFTYTDNTPEYRLPEFARDVRPIHTYAVLNLWQRPLNNEPNDPEKPNAFPHANVTLADPRKPTRWFMKSIEEIIMNGKFTSAGFGKIPKDKHLDEDPEVQEDVEEETT